MRLVPNLWYAILESKEVKPGKLLGVTRMGVKLVFWRDNKGTIQCIADRCVHRGASLSAGKIVGDNIQCPFHGFEYDGAGSCKRIPSNGRATLIPHNYVAPSYVVRENHGFIWIWWGEKRKDYPDIKFFENLDDSFSISSFQSLWRSHYSRAIENQLDVAHVPFVHSSTIGRGGRTLVNGPGCRLDGDSLYVYPRNEVDNGQKPLKPNEVDPNNSGNYLHFIFPNIWQNYISDKLRVVVAFAPIDEDNTMMYIRQYQKMIRIPILKHAFDALGKTFNRIVANQDKPVVEAQFPKKSSLDIGEFLVQADWPIILYRKRIKELGEYEVRK